MINVNNVICGRRGGGGVADVCRGGCYFSGNVHEGVGRMVGWGG